MRERLDREGLRRPRRQHAGGHAAGDVCATFVVAWPGERPD